MKQARQIALAEVDRATLAPWSRGRSTTVQLMRRAKIVLLAAVGKMKKEIAAELGIDHVMALRMRKGRATTRSRRYAVCGIAVSTNIAVQSHDLRIGSALGVYAAITSQQVGQVRALAPVQSLATSSATVFRMKTNRHSLRS